MVVVMSSIILGKPVCFSIAVQLVGKKVFQIDVIKPFTVEKKIVLQSIIL